jgi:hypothetical protein
MTSGKVYVIEPKTSDARGQGWGSPAERDALGKAIGTLAKAANTPVFFHARTDLAAGSSFILLECSEAFLEQVKALPEFGRATEKQPYFLTARSADLWSYFTGEPAMPAHGQSPSQPVRRPARRYKL